jgi:hypothetical protein
MDAACAALLLDLHVVGADKFSSDFNTLNFVTYMVFAVEEMGIWMPRVLRYFWIFTWSVLTPILVLTVIVSSLVDRKPDNTEGHYSIFSVLLQEGYSLYLIFPQLIQTILLKL